MRKIKYVICFVPALLLTSAEAQTGFEFRTLRTGVTEAQIVSAFGDRYEHGGRVPNSMGPECFNSLEGRVCGFGTMKASYSAAVNNGLVWNVSYKFQTTADESPESFIQAFTKLYGKPTIAQRTHSAEGDDRLSVPEYIWYRGSQELSVEAVCDESILRRNVWFALTGSLKSALGIPYNPRDNLGSHCISIVDAESAPTPQD